MVATRQPDNFLFVVYELKEEKLRKYDATTKIPYTSG